MSPHGHWFSSFDLFEPAGRDYLLGFQGGLKGGESTLVAEMR
jgi:hypothetical protein